MSRLSSVLLALAALAAAAAADGTDPTRPRLIDFNPWSWIPNNNNRSPSIMDYFFPPSRTPKQSNLDPPADRQPPKTTISQTTLDNTPTMTTFQERPTTVARKSSSKTKSTIPATNPTATTPPKTRKSTHKPITPETTIETKVTQTSKIESTSAAYKPTVVTTTQRPTKHYTIKAVVRTTETPTAQDTESTSNADNDSTETISVSETSGTTAEEVKDTAAPTLSTAPEPRSTDAGTATTTTFETTTLTDSTAAEPADSREGYLPLRDKPQQTHVKINEQTKKEVLSALLFYANGDYQRVIGEANYLSQETISGYVQEVTEALNHPHVTKKFIKFPCLPEDRQRTTQNFYNKYGFPGVLGSIDGSHFKIKKPKRNEEHLYFCRKHYHSINVQVTVPLPAGSTSVLAKPTKYHYYPHNQHIYLLPECAIQQVCNAVYVRLNYTQPLCACPARYRDPCSASLNADDLHTTRLTTDSKKKYAKKAVTLVKTCEAVSEMRECRAPRDWSLLALQNIRTGKSHYLVICRCPDTHILEGPMSHDQPTYASVPGIRVYGMMCVRPTTVYHQGYNANRYAGVVQSTTSTYKVDYSQPHSYGDKPVYNRYQTHSYSDTNYYNRRSRAARAKRMTQEYPPFPWYKVKELARSLHWIN